MTTEAKRDGQVGSEKRKGKPHLIYVDATDQDCWSAFVAEQWLGVKRKGLFTLFARFWRAHGGPERAELLRGKAVYAGGHRPDSPIKDRVHAV